MTDVEIRNTLLQQFGEEPGPITDTTRDIYERKLARRMDGSIIPSKREFSEGKKMVDVGLG